MSLFAVLGLPCLTAFVLAADQKTIPGRAVTISAGSGAVQFLKGFFYAVPCLVVMFVLRHHMPLSYRSFPLYLFFLLTDHLIPVVFLGVLYFFAYTRSGYVELLLFGGGLYSLVGLIDVLARFGQYESYHLFLLPVVRMSALLFITIFFLRYHEWYGVVRVLFLILLISLPFLGAAVSYLYMRALVFWAVLSAAMLFLASLLYTFAERKI
jgi:hypothetical protein